ncbi:Uncharacterized protein OBRU01_23162 [Operophtera brumata]|uniref:Uncharacterized protein n=1 Tax=Operophtera brumata TaxID=104452 RepID=A0A0L7KQ03_OPEBR|nr:Uncharacterized protein OBRU01_23162 [Operophtera brumata]
MLQKSAALHAADPSVIQLDIYSGVSQIPPRCGEGSRRHVCLSELLMLQISAALYAANPRVTQLDMDSGVSQIPPRCGEGSRRHVCLSGEQNY